MLSSIQGAACWYLGVGIPNWVGTANLAVAGASIAYAATVVYAGTPGVLSAGAQALLSGAGALTVGSTDASVAYATGGIITVSYTHRTLPTTPCVEITGVACTGNTEK